MFRKSILLLALLAIQGCTSESAPRNQLQASHPVTLEQYQQSSGNPSANSVSRNQFDANSPRSTADGSGSVIINIIGQGTDHSNPLVREWKVTNCRPGTAESRRYPCVTSDQYGNACQLGSCLPVDLYRGNQ
jgi:hypothetical protein